VKPVHAGEMKTYMNDIRLTQLNQVEQFLVGTHTIDFKPLSLEEGYAWIARTLKRFGYPQLRKRDKSLVRDYLLKTTGYSRQQLTRLIEQYRENHWIGKRRKPRHCFPKRYTRDDILLLAELDECHQTLSGPATKKLCERAYYVFNEKAYGRLAAISIAHLYNLRKHYLYSEKRRHFTKTQRTAVPIGERRKPCPNGEPGYLRIDTVHQGDLDKEKGVYHINAVDEVTQMEVVCAVEKISENYLIPVLEALIEAFPFQIKGIHADNGSEYINQTVARLLQKLLIELTKSRARHSNDNALAESKNGAIIRKHLGYFHIPQKWAPLINDFYKKYFNYYINYHRPCFFAEIKIDAKGKQKKTYPYRAMMTPYDKLKTISNAEKYLKPGITFKQLDKLAMALTDGEAANKMQEARAKLFKTILSDNIK
jgi:transposase InsO family protein